MQHAPLFDSSQFAISVTAQQQHPPHPFDEHRPSEVKAVFSEACRGRNGPMTSCFSSKCSHPPRPANPTPVTFVASSPIIAGKAALIESLHDTKPSKAFGIRAGRRVRQESCVDSDTAEDLAPTPGTSALDQTAKSSRSRSTKWRPHTAGAQRAIVRYQPVVRRRDLVS